MTKARVLLIEDDLELAEILSIALEKEGFIAVVAHSVEEAMSRLEDGRPDLAIVDLVLPDGLGSDLLDVLKRLVPPVPSIAISGVFRGDRYDRNITRRHRAKCFFQKPFSTSDLISEASSILESQASASEPEDEHDSLEIEVAWDNASSPTNRIDEAEHGLDKPAEKRPIVASSSPPSSTREPNDSSGAPASQEPSGDGEISETEEPRQETSLAEQPHKDTGIVENLIEVDHADTDKPPPQESSSWSKQPSRKALDPGMPSLSSPVAPQESLRETITPPSRGELRERSVPVLLVSLGKTESDATLELRHESASKTIHLRKGQPTFATSNLSGDRLLEFAVKTKAIRKEDADTAQLLAKEEGRRIGEVLIELDVLGRSHLRDLVRDQVRSIIFSTFSWREGLYSISFSPKKPRVPAALSMPLHSLILEGTKTSLPLVLLRKEIPDNLVLAPKTGLRPSVKGLSLPPDANHLLELADGSKTVEDMLALSDEDERAIRATLKALLDLELLDPRDEKGPRRQRIGFVV